jgi:hypothetical protein
MANWQLRLFGLLLLILVAGCGDPPNTAKSVVVTPSTGSVGINKVQQYYATVYNYSNQVMVKTVTWSVTGSIGTIDAAGKFYAGSTLTSGTIMAQADSASTTISVFITDKGSISGVITDDTGAKGASTYVYLNDQPALGTTSDLNGNYSIAQVPVGAHEIRTRESMNHLAASKTVSIEAGTNSALNLTLPTRFSATENIVDAGGVMTVSVTVKNNGSTEAIGVQGIYNFYDYNDEGALIWVGGSTKNFGNLAAGSSATASFSMTTTTYTNYTKVVSCSSY